MSSHYPEPLDDEERELAQRLARIGSPGEPSPSLDTKILAAAHDAVAKRAPSDIRRRRRWPVAFGVAASLALAVGVAWQLRPLPQAPPVYNEAASPAAAADNSSAAAASVAAPDLVMPPQPAEYAVARELSPPPAESKNAQAKVASERDDSAGAEAVAQAPIVFETPRPVDAQAASPAPPAPPPPAAAATSATPEFVPPPPAPAAPASTMEQQRTHTEQAARAANTPSRPLPGAASKPRGAETLDTVTSDAAAAEGSEEGFDERPPNTADSPEVRQAWLQRIRELIAHGETTAARDSLQEFKRRYPGVVLPDDLRRFDRPL